MRESKLGKAIFSFFEDYLKCQKGLRSASIKSYRDTMRLFLAFAANQNGCKITSLKLSDFTSARILAFLRFIEVKRNNKPQTRNQRLTALRTFFEFLSIQNPLMLKEAQKVLAIPLKRAKMPGTFFLERNEVAKLFHELQLQKSVSLRDQALLLFLYNTGARVQEVANLLVENLEFGEMPRVHLTGKGGKWRICPLWKETCRLLQKLLEDRTFIKEDMTPVFISRTGNSLTRFGIYKLVRKYTANIIKKDVDGHPRHISPHIFRHSTAVHLLEAGVEVNVIRSWLGHVSLETTNRYAEINLKMKAEALQVCNPQFDTEPISQKQNKWHDNSTLLKWLNSL